MIPIPLLWHNGKTPTISHSSCWHESRHIELKTWNNLLLKYHIRPPIMRSCEGWVSMYSNFIFTHFYTRLRSRESFIHARHSLLTYRAFTETHSCGNSTNDLSSQQYRGHSLPRLTSVNPTSDRGIDDDNNTCQSSRDRGQPALQMTTWLLANDNHRPR